MEAITKPTLVLDEERCRKNIHRMAEKARSAGVRLRPHFKTHQSAEIGNWFREEGINGITVSSLTMAEYFANHGWEDITVAFPTNIREGKLINTLASKLSLGLVVESTDTVLQLEKKLQHPVSIWIKVDAGYGRTGVSWNDVDELSRIHNEIEQVIEMEFQGFLCHAGHSYGCRGKEEILNVHQNTLERMAYVGEHFTGALLSIGDTPTCSVAEDFTGIDEIRPGNFVFYDLVQEQIGACGYKDIAIAMACPVVALHPEREEVVVYGGSVHFASDQLEENGRKLFGKLVKFDGTSWSDPIPDAYVKKLSQEHGIIHMPEDEMDGLEIGDLVFVLPVHACTNANLMKSYLTTEGQTISRI